MKSATLLITAIALVNANPVVETQTCVGRCDAPEKLFTEDGKTMGELMMELMEADIADAFAQNRLAPEDSLVGGPFACVDGKANGYPCKNVDLMSMLTHRDMGGSGSGNDIWGWTDETTGREYAIVGQTDGTAFVDITDATNPVYIGRLKTKTSNSSWRDIKVSKNHAYIVAEASNHGVQVFDLTTLKDAKSTTLVETSYFAATKRCHNIVINEETDMAFCVGSSDVCRGGLYMIDISDPKNLKNVGCYSADGYTHDAQCVIYRGPDAKYRGKEICFSYNEDTVSIVDVTSRSAPVLISKSSYNGYAYTHQGWLTEDQTFVMFDDELDEQRGSNGNGGVTTTYIMDVSSLENPKLTGTYLSPVKSIDHNLYIMNGYGYLSNYCSGLRIVDVKGIKTNNLFEWGYFDVRPEDDKVAFNGAWSSFPYFKSGNVIVNSIEKGLFVVKPQFGGGPVTTTTKPATTTTRPATTTTTTTTTTSATPSPTGTPCAHDKCVTGGTLSSACDPCVAQINSGDWWCRNWNWGSNCVSKVKSVCGITC